MRPLDAILRGFIDKRFDFSEIKSPSKLNIKNQNLLIVLEEILMNATEHGKGPIQFFYQDAGETFTFLLFDRGPGIHERVPQNPRLMDTKGKSTASILRLALEEGITGTGTIGRGMGLFYLSKFTKDHEAESLIASDSAFIYQKAHHFHEHSLPEELSGSVVLLRVRHKDAGT